MTAVSKSVIVIDFATAAAAVVHVAMYVHPDAMPRSISLRFSALMYGGLSFSQFLNLLIFSPYINVVPLHVISPVDANGSVYSVIITDCLLFDASSAGTEMIQPGYQWNCGALLPLI